MGKRLTHEEKARRAAAKAAQLLQRYIDSSPMGEMLRNGTPPEHWSGGTTGGMLLAALKSMGEVRAELEFLQSRDEP